MSLLASNCHVVHITDIVFSLQETLQYEVRLVDSLYRLGVQSTDLLSTLSLKVHSDHKSFVVDMRSEHVVVRNSVPVILRILSTCVPVL